MTKEEAKQYLRNLIDSSIKRQYSKDIFDLCYNKQYLRALKLSKNIGQPVNKNDFNLGGILFRINAEYNIFYFYPKIRDYLEENYSTDFHEHIKIVKEVINEYEDYKGYYIYIRW